jgi:hypothetical protein
MRDSMVQTDTTATKGKSAAENSTALNAGDAFAGLSSDLDISLPDLLQSFGRMVNRRQQLTDSLPGVVRERLTEATQSAGVPSVLVDGSTGNEGNTIQQGLSGLIRQNRAALDVTRQIAYELEFVERVPDLVEIFSADQRALAPEALQSAVDKGLSTLQSTAVKDPRVSDPAMILTTLLDKAIQSGTVGKELAGWLDTMTIAMDNAAEDPEMMLQLSAWSNRVDPEVARLAEATGRPELVKVWAATQAWGSSLSDTLGTTVSTGSAGTFSESAETIKTALQSLATATGSATSLQSAAYPASVASRIGQFELLLSSLGTRPEAMSTLLTLLPELVSAAEKKMPVKTEGKATAAVHDTLARSAPKWLQTMASRTGKPELLDFWVACKMADLAPWAKLSAAERQEAAVVLKELSTTYEQPNVFKTTSEDASSRGLILQMALYAPEQGKTYPALIQIFEEKRERGNGNPPEQEVWVRVSLETDNIGGVDLSFRLQDKKYLSIFSRFADSEAASAFRTAMPELRKDFAGTSLELKKIAVTHRTGMGGTTDG